MKKLTLFVLILFFKTLTSYSQTLEYIFLNHPEIDLGKKYRQKMINAFKTDNKEQLKSEGSSEINYYFLTDFDPNNGYLFYANYSTLRGACITYWNQKDGTKLVGLSKLYGEHPVDQKIKFHILTKDRKFISVNKKSILPSLSNTDFLDVEKLRKLNIDPDSLIDAHFRNHDLYYRFPEEGKNIRVISQVLTSDGYDGEFSEYELGTLIELIWDNGKFKRGGFIDF